MSYLNSSKRKSLYSFKKWVIIFFVILIVFLLRSFLQPLFLFISKPFIHTGQTIEANVDTALQTATLSKAQLLDQITLLKKQNEELVLRIGFLENQQTKFTDIEKNFGLVPKENSFLLTPIISKPNQSAYDTLILAKGTNDGISVGQYVYMDTYAVLGVIDSVTNTASVVKLFSSPATNTQARLERTGYDITLIGRGGGNMIVEIPKEIETALGDRISFPPIPNTVVGVIRDITLDDRSVYKKLYVTLPVNILTLDFVYVVK